MMEPSLKGLNGGGEHKHFEELVVIRTKVERLEEALEQLCVKLDGLNKLDRVADGLEKLERTMHRMAVGVVISTRAHQRVMRHMEKVVPLKLVIILCAIICAAFGAEKILPVLMKVWVG